MRRSLALLAALLSPAALSAQEAGGFTVLHGSDTVAVEEFSRHDVELQGSLLRGLANPARARVRYRATLVDDGSAPLVDLSAWSGEDPADGPARKTARVIFKDDSAAVDDASRGGGVMTRILPTARAAIPYLNLSTAWLEQATHRLASSATDSLAVPFFNLDGGQTLVGSVRHLGADSALVQIGPVQFRLRVDPSGRILGGAVPGQDLRILRTAGR